MSQSRRDDELVERACAAIRQEAEGIDPARAEAALERVRERLGVQDVPGHVLGCADIQRLLPAFLAGTLPAEREMLVADHTRSCIACRKALKALVRPQETAPVVAFERRRLPRWVLPAAAAVIVLLGIQAVVLRQLWPGAGRGAVLQVIRGALVGIGAKQAQTFGAGSTVPYGQPVVTPLGQSALVRLADGSIVELRERTRFAVERRWGGTNLAVEGGDVIVEAAKQSPGKHLWVTTRDCEVAVVGTVFAVDAGTRGSRVSVYEGEVHVAQAGQKERVLHPGAQATTSARVKPMPLAQEVDWSARREQHMALLTGVALLGQEMAGLPAPVTRFEASYLDRLPATTVFYAAMPNLSGNLEEGLARVRERIATDARLQALAGQGEELAKLGSVLQHVANLGGDLGEELSAVAWTGADGKMAGPVLLASVADPAGFRAHLESELPQIQRDLVASGPGKSSDAMGEHLHVVTDETVAQAQGDGLLIWASDAQRTLVVACNEASLRGMAAALADAAQPFRDNAFRATIAQRYATGVEGVLAVDLARLIASQKGDAEAQRMAKLGLDGLQHLVLEQWSDGPTTRRQAVLSFDGARHGIASWLAAPGPMGALGFFSPESTAVAAFVTKEPALLLEDVMAALTAEERDHFEQDRANFQREHGWDPIEDLAKPLGGEIAIGIDGPVVPTPSWKLVLEVYDPARFQVGMERLVADLDQQLRKQGEGGASLQAEGDGWLLRRTRANGTEVDAHYRYQDGYLVATASSALLDNAMKYRSSGQGLLQSPKLRALLPSDREINLSALWYQDLSGVLGPISGALRGMQGMTEQGEGGEGAAQGKPPVQLQQLAETLGKASGPTVAFAYGEEDAIRVASSSPRNPMGLIDLFLMKGAGGMGPLGSGGVQ
jgi:hypothetical protein